jgi:hypothetical protein
MPKGKRKGNDEKAKWTILKNYGPTVENDFDFRRQRLSP